METSQPKIYELLPPLAGVCSLDDAARSGMSVDQCVSRLKRYHYVLKRLHEILTARITSEPIFELKTAFSFHAHLCAEHVTAFRTRVGEMREPPLGLDAVPNESLQIVCDEILSAPSTSELLVGVYTILLPALSAALKRHIQDTNILVDHPSVRICRFAGLEVTDMITFGQKAVGILVAPEQKCEMAEWAQFLNAGIVSAGGLDGSNPETMGVPTRKYSVSPYVYDGVPKRDERFIDPYNRGVNAEAFLYDESYPAHAKTLMMFFKRLREIDVPEMMASIITATKGKPWLYYRDMSRQLWD